MAWGLTTFLSIVYERTGQYCRPKTLSIELPEDYGRLTGVDEALHFGLVDAGHPSQDRQCGFGVATAAPASHFEKRIEGFGAKLGEHLRVTRHGQRHEDE